MRQVRQYGLASDDFPILMAIGALETYLSVHRNAGFEDSMLDDIATLLVERASLSSKPWVVASSTFLMAG